MQKILGLILETRDGAERLSIGRVLLVIVFTASMYIWFWEEKDIPANMSLFMMSLVAYVVGGKAIDAVKSFAKPKAPVKIPPKRGSW